VVEGIVCIWVIRWYSLHQPIHHRWHHWVGGFDRDIKGSAARARALASTEENVVPAGVLLHMFQSHDTGIHHIRVADMRYFEGLTYKAAEALAHHRIMSYQATLASIIHDMWDDTRTVVAPTSSPPAMARCTKHSTHK
jgi:hypothetical protein